MDDAGRATRRTQCAFQPVLVAMLSTIVPAHNEAEHIGRCLTALAVAAADEHLRGEPVAVFVVLDDCSDDTGRIALAHGAITLSSRHRNVGAARALGAEAAIARGARWLAFTDADTEVGPEWLVAQLAHLAEGSEAVCGTVAVRDWGSYGRSMQAHHEATYFDVDGHRHIHGANLGVSTAAYRRAGGFEPLVSHEDVALVRALQHVGTSIAWSAAPRVYTSARRSFRAPQGFGSTLARVEREALQRLAPAT
jgi:glycosyltransferase involved in cell wall biosynthesis